MSMVVLASSLVLLFTVVAQYLPSSPASRTNTPLRKPLVGTVVLALAGVLIVLTLRLGGIALPSPPSSVLKGYVAFAHSTDNEREVAGIVADEVSAGSRVVIAGWPGFAIALYAGVVGQVTVLPQNTPDVRVTEALLPGDLLVVLGDKTLWSHAMPQHELTQQWAIDQWLGLRVGTPQHFTHDRP